MKGALDAPFSEFGYALTESYIDWVHPFCPLLDLGNFIAAILSNGTRGQSVYDFKYENDQLRIVQSLLPMSYWQETHEDPTNHWFWAATACLMAHTIGLFRDPAQSRMPENKQRLWKRVGWSCLLRDRILSLGVRQRPKVIATEFDLPLLELTDFEVIGPSTLRIATGTAVTLARSEFLQDTVLQQKLAQLCIERTELCILVDEVFRTLYVSMNRSLGTTTENTDVLLPKIDTINLESTTNIDTRLQIWLRQLPEYSMVGLNPDLLLHGDKSIMVVHSKLLKMLFHTITCTLCNPPLLSLSSRPTTEGDSLRLAQRITRHFTVQITRHFEDLHAFGLIRFLPSASVTMLLTAAVNLLVERRASPPDGDERYNRHFWASLYYLKLLQGIHIYAQSASQFLNSVAHHSGAHIVGASVRGKNDDNLGVWASVHALGHLLEPAPATGQKWVQITDYSHNNVPHSILPYPAES